MKFYMQSPGCYRDGGHTLVKVSAESGKAYWSIRWVGKEIAQAATLAQAKQFFSNLGR